MQTFPANDTPRISVVICAHNAGNTLGEQLAALAPQIPPAQGEIVVVNNLSSDNTIDIARAFQPSIPSLRVVDASDRKGKAYAVNVGVRAARSDKLALTDADDVVAPSWLAAIARGLDEQAATTGPIETTALNGGQSPMEPRPQWATRPQLGFLPFMCGTNRGFRRWAFEKVGGVNESLLRGEDVDFSWRLQLAGVRINVDEEALVYVRMRTDDASTWRMLVQNAVAHVQLYKRFASQGMPRPKLRSVFNRYRRIAVGALHYRKLDTNERLRWKRKIAVAWGHLLGSLRYRRLYL
jgi:glycosyltransferase involved in cell wall biosynthesis